TFAPSSACAGEGRGGGQRWRGLPARFARAPIPTFPRRRGKEQGLRRFRRDLLLLPPPLAGEGWGGASGGAVFPRALRAPPSRPSPAGGGRGQTPARRLRAQRLLGPLSAW